MLDGKHDEGHDEIKELLDRHRKNDMMNDLMMWGGMYGFGNYRSNPNKNQNKKKKKPKAENWFEKLTGDQLKQLCRTSGLPVSGTKSQLVQRLLESDITNKHSHPSSKKYLEEECREKGLKVSGTVYDLVLRLLEHKTGKTGSPGDGKKRVRDDDANDDGIGKDSSAMPRKRNLEQRL